MTQHRSETEHESKEPKPEPIRVHLPGFWIEKETGLGDLANKAIRAAGVSWHCTGCDRRRAKLNRWMIFTR
jgi:hypothetical protein